MGKRKRKASSQSDDEGGDAAKRVRGHEQRAKSRIMDMPEKVLVESSDWTFSFA